MVLFLIADLALTLAFKLSAWCLGKTYDGIVYIVTYKSKPNVHPTPEPVSEPESNQHPTVLGGCTDCVIITRQEYLAMHHNHASSSLADSLTESSK
jgi:hypothetical protein